MSTPPLVSEVQQKRAKEQVQEPCEESREAESLAADVGKRLILHYRFEEDEVAKMFRDCDPNDYRKVFRIAGEELKRRRGISLLEFVLYDWCFAP